MSIKGTGTTKMLQEGRLTVPKPVREQLDLSRGDLVRIEVKPIDKGK
jgi:AbrB family looped-hinge helix DNA binding protein